MGLRLAASGQGISKKVANVGNPRIDPNRSMFVEAQKTGAKMWICFQLLVIGALDSRRGSHSVLAWGVKARIGSQCCTILSSSPS